MDELIKKYLKIGEVSKILNVPASTIRYWDKEFSQVKPLKNKKGDRIFTTKDIETLKEIKYLVHDKGVKIANAGRKINKSNEILDNKNAEVLKRLLDLKDTLLRIKENL